MISIHPLARTRAEIREAKGSAAKIVQHYNISVATVPNAKRSDRMQAIQALKDEIAGLEKELAAAQHELEVAKMEAEDAKNRKNREYAEAVRRVNETGVAYIRLGESGGIDPKTGKTKEESGVPRVFRGTSKNCSERTERKEPRSESPRHIK